MGDPRGFMKYGRQDKNIQPVHDRLKHHNEHYNYPSEEEVKTQAARCMDCGVPFCMTGCPLGKPDSGMERPGLSWSMASGTTGVTGNQ